MKIHWSIKVIGKVQGVGFRYEAKKMADTFGVSGFARNEPDGSVLVEAEGEETDLRRFVGWCREGVPLAKVKEVRVTPRETLERFPAFVIQ